MWPARWGGSSSNGGVVTDRISLILGAVILGAIALDIFANGGNAMLFLLRKLADLLEYLSFWR